MRAGNKRTMVVVQRALHVKFNIVHPRRRECSLSTAWDAIRTAPAAATTRVRITHAAAPRAAAAAVVDALLKLSSPGRPGPFGWAHGPRGDTWVGTNMLQPCIGHGQHAAVDGCDGGRACARHASSNLSVSSGAMSASSATWLTSAWVVASTPTAPKAGAAPMRITRAAATRAAAAAVVDASPKWSSPGRPGPGLGPFGWAHGPRGDTWVGTNMLQPCIGHGQHATVDGCHGGGACDIQCGRAGLSSWVGSRGSSRHMGRNQRVSNLREDAASMLRPWT